MTKENPSRIRLRTVHRDRRDALNGLERIREAAKRDKNLKFTNLMHHITEELLRSSYYLLKRDVATGVDNVTWQSYGEQLEVRLADLHERVQSGKYRAKPAKRVWLPKPDGKQRPIGITALEDKIVQQAAVQVLSQIYEQDFLGFSNIYLHYVLDEWVELWRKSRAQGDVIIVRYSDDFVMGFQYKHVAERFLVELKDRFAKHGLEIHEEKTRIIEFGRFTADNRAKRGDKKPETFDFLGFTHICSKTRKNKWFTIRRKTSAKKFRMKVEEVRKEIIRKRHEPVPEQGKWLRSVVQGHLNYFAVPGNKRAIDAFRTEINKAWLFALRRRSQKSKNLTWDRIKRLTRTWIPKARIIHPYPNQRLSVNIQGRSRMR